MNKAIKRLIIGIMAAGVLLAPSTAAAAEEEIDAAGFSSSEDFITEFDDDLFQSFEGIEDEAAEEEEETYAVSTVEDVVDAENGVVQINCVYVDDDDNHHIIKGATGFIVGTQGDSSSQYLITSRQGVMPDKAYKKAALRHYGVKKAEVEDKLNNIAYEVVVTKGISYDCSLYKQSEELDLAVFTVSEKLATRKPLSIYTADNGNTNELPYGTTDMVYSIGFPDAVTYDTNAVKYEKSDIVLSTGKIVNIHTLNDIYIITHDSKVDANNCGGPLVNEDGNVIGMNILSSDGQYSVAIDSTEIVDVLDSLGIEFNKLTPGTMEPEEEPVDDTGASFVSTELPQQIIESHEEEKIPTKLIVALVSVIAVLLITLIVVIVLMFSKRTPLTEEEKQKKAKEKADKKAAKKAKKNQKNEPIRPFNPVPSGNINMNQSGGTGMETNALGLSQEAGTTLLSGGPVINQPQGVTMNGGTLIRKKTGDNIILCKSVTTIGKDSLHVDYCIRDNSAVSRIHAAFTVNDQGVYVEDKNSTNGTFINGVKLNANEAKILNKGDIIRIANEEFEYRK